MSITYQVEMFDDMFQEGTALFISHWKEIARNKSKIKLDIDYEGYIETEKAGMLHIATVRDEGKLVGYCVYIVYPHLHYKNNLFAKNDVIFISDEYRGEGVGRKLIEFSDRELEKLGVCVITMSMKLAHDFGPLMESLNYVEFERTYEKVLK